MAHDDKFIRQEAVMEKLKEVQAYRGHDLYAAVVQLLVLIDDSYRDDLIEVSIDGLRFKQGAAKQCRMLKDALVTGDDRLLPKV